eukprot:TRINITY_DN2146_c0_g1_i3.p1 TRINITY_DN2146_c0_g1~~TRINITY_DN2146_c0_g1_i3.p1  ORF type:complete len:168 (-),score=25.86 TRINITY_DN2146_c0_g1_i3:11-514(-)
MLSKRFLITPHIPSSTKTRKQTLSWETLVLTHNNSIGAKIVFDDLSQAMKCTIFSLYAEMVVPILQTMFTLLPDGVQVKQNSLSKSNIHLFQQMLSTLRNEILFVKDIAIESMEYSSNDKKEDQENSGETLLQRLWEHKKKLLSLQISTDQAFSNLKTYFYKENLLK